MKLEKKDIERFSARFAPKGYPGVKVVKEHQYCWVKNFTLTGDAPKEFVRIYEYVHGGKIRKQNKSTWPAYIAKTGHKWYPNESLTEYLMNLLGEAFGLKMAESGIVIINGQLRFLSKYFLNPKKEQLIHGAEIFAGFLQDEKFVEYVEANDESRNVFTLQFVESAVGFVFPEQKNEIMHELVRLVLFDALVGNNDRHYYNWGVISPLEAGKKIRFAPVYDTARGLFWNDDDEKVVRRCSRANDRLQYIEKYCNGSRPKLGWEGEQNLNHFIMAECIAESDFYISHTELEEMFGEDVLKRMLALVENKFGRLFIPERVTLIKDCLTYRFNKLKEIMKL